MSTLFLIEATPAADALTTLVDIDNRVTAHGAQLIEAQVTTGGRLFAIVEAEDSDVVHQALEGLDADVSDPAPVRLVGADLDAVKAARPEAGYLVEWDIPEGISMDTYLERKAAKTPLYANVPEVAFLRTYVREDMQKCLCFYDGPDEAAIERARDAVSTPIDRLHVLSPFPAVVK